MKTNHHGDHKMYLGDGVYVDFDGSTLILTTGITVPNRIVLQPEVYAALLSYVETLRRIYMG